MEYEMLLTDEYVEKTAKKLGVELIRVDVPMPLDEFGMRPITTAGVQGKRWRLSIKRRASSKDLF